MKNKKNAFKLITMPDELINDTNTLLEDYKNLKKKNSNFIDEIFKIGQCHIRAEYFKDVADRMWNRTHDIVYYEILKNLETILPKEWQEDAEKLGGKQIFKREFIKYEDYLRETSDTIERR